MAPQFTPDGMLSPVVVYSGETISLSCQATGFPPPTFTWTKGGLPVSVSFTSGEGNHMLNVPLANTLSEDVYACIATNNVGGVDIGSVMSSTVVNVTGTVTHVLLYTCTCVWVSIILNLFCSFCQAPLSLPQLSHPH